MVSKKHEYNLQYWSAMIQDRLESGMTVKEWCKEKGTTKYAYYYWLEKLREEHYEEAIQGLKAAAPAAKGNQLVSTATGDGTGSNTFVEIRPPEAAGLDAAWTGRPQPSAVLNYGRLGIEIYGNMAAEVIERLIRVLDNAQA